MKKEVREMWLIYGNLFEDKSMAKKLEDGKETVKKVYVAVDKGTGKVNKGNELNYKHWVYDTKKNADEDVADYNS